MPVSIHICCVNYAILFDLILDLQCTGSPVCGDRHLAVLACLHRKRELADSKNLIAVIRCSANPNHAIAGSPLCPGCRQRHCIGCPARQRVLRAFITACPVYLIGSVCHLNGEIILRCRNDLHAAAGACREPRPACTAEADGAYTHTEHRWSQDMHDAVLAFGSRFAFLPMKEKVMYRLHFLLCLHLLSVRFWCGNQKAQGLSYAL